MRFFRGFYSARVCTLALVTLSCEKEQPDQKKNNFNKTKIACKLPQNSGSVAPVQPSTKIFK